MIRLRRRERLRNLLTLAVVLIASAVAMALPGARILIEASLQLQAMPSQDWLHVLPWLALSAAVLALLPSLAADQLDVGSVT